VTPTAVVGHSSGEIAAAYCAGGLSRASAWSVAYYRGIVSASLVNSGCEPGAMMAVTLSESAIKPYLSQIQLHGGNISIGCINSPRSVTISGSERAIDELKMVLDQDNVFCRKLLVNVAYHSKFMINVALLYQELIPTLESGSCLGKITMFSSVTGQRVFPIDLSQKEYWVQNMVSPVLFLHAITKICFSLPQKLARNKIGRHAIQVDHFLEIGPHAALQGPIRDISNDTEAAKPATYNSILVRNKSAQDTALEVVGELHCMGYPVKLEEVNDLHAESRCMLVDLPAYPFDHTKKHWLESRISQNYRFRKWPHHELLGAPVADWNPLEPRWRNIISLDNSPWIKDHKVCWVSNDSQQSMANSTFRYSDQMCILPLECSS
jgi:acyl transferase domain-containing protein